jgi:hypothetical protein
MNTIKLIAFAIFAVITLNSCTDGGLSENPERWHVEDLTVLSESWVLKGNPDELGSYYEYVFDNFPYVNGIMSVFMFQDPGTDKEIQLPLPHTDFFVDVASDESEYHYSIQYSYDVAVDGSIALKVFRSDYRTNWFRPGTILFRVAVIY